MLHQFELVQQIRKNTLASPANRPSKQFTLTRAIWMQAPGALRSKSMGSRSTIAMVRCAACRQNGRDLRRARHR